MGIRAGAGPPLTAQVNSGAARLMVAAARFKAGTLPAKAALRIKKWRIDCGIFWTEWPGSMVYSE